MLLVFRRCVSAKRRTIVFSTVRPSLQLIIELSNKFQVFYTFNGIIRPMNHISLSVCRHLSALHCKDECSLIPRWIMFSFGTWKEHILERCFNVLLLKNLKNYNFGVFFKNSDLGALAWLLMVVWMDEFSLIPRRMLFFFSTWREYILELCPGV